MDSRPHDFKGLFERKDRGAEVEAMEREIFELSAHINAATYHLVTLIAEFDRRQGWTGWGVLSCAHWLNWKCGLGFNAAREKLRVGHALASLPQVSEAFSRGEVSYSKARAITRVATPENESYLLMIARHGTTAHVEKLVRAYRGVLRYREEVLAGKQHEERGVGWHHDEDGSVVVNARLPAEQGALLVKAIEASRERLDAERAEDPSMPRAPFATRRADALVAMAEHFLASPDASASGGDRNQIVVHVDEQVLRDRRAEGRCELEDGPWLATETGRRLACDASLVPVVERVDGSVLDVGRKTRTIPPAIRRALAARDGGCRFPGCTHRHFTDAHHIEHWANGGETKLGNLVLLCRAHHRLVHEGGFDVRILDDGALRFTRPDGRPIPVAWDVSAETSGSVGGVEAVGRGANPDIGPRTGACLWDGVHMDLAMAIDGLAQKDGIIESVFVMRARLDPGSSR